MINKDLLYKFHHEYLKIIVKNYYFRKIILINLQTLKYNLLIK